MRARQHLLLMRAGCLECRRAEWPAARSRPAQTTRWPASAAAVAAGQTLYSQLCQTCHGPAGQGGDRGPALTSGTFTHGSGDADLFRSIRSGVRGTQMPPFPGLSDTQIWQLVAYVRSLQATAQLRLPRARVRPAPSGVEGQCGRRRNAVLRPCRVRELSRSERPRRDRRTGPVECRTTLA